MFFVWFMIEIRMIFYNVVWSRLCIKSIIKGVDCEKLWFSLIDILKEILCFLMYKVFLWFLVWVIYYFFILFRVVNLILKKFYLFVVLELDSVYYYKKFWIWLYM